jgi:hypothetical protein
MCAVWPVVTCATIPRPCFRDGVCILETSNARGNTDWFKPRSNKEPQAATVIAIDRKGRAVRRDLPLSAIGMRLTE